MRSLTRAAGEQQVLTDLVNTLLAEDLFGITTRSELHTRAAGPSSSLAERDEASTHLLRFWVEPGKRFLLIPITPAVTQPYRTSSGAVIEVECEPHVERPLSAVDFLQALASAASHEGSVSRLCDELRLAAAQGELSNGALDTLPAPRLTSLLDLERWAAFRDRPFHPVAKAKVGWNEAEYRCYAPEFHREVTLRWMAVRRDHLLFGRDVQGRSPSELLLPEPEARAVMAAMEQAGLSPADYMALPVHPWQMERTLPRELQPEVAESICVPLRVEAGGYVASSSLRSLAPVGGGGRHVKLPIGIESLGAIRSLSALSMRNGERGQQLLHQVLMKDSILRERLHLCDETVWFAFYPPGSDWWEDRPRHLSCLIREYPARLLCDSRVQLVPMSALAQPGTASHAHLFTSWLARRGQGTASRADVLELFRSVSTRFLGLAMRLLRHGVLPEIHGQNVLLVLNDGEVDGLLLRDHDTVRIHLPWLQEAGLSDPHYIVKPGRPNSLYNETPEALLGYLQTLGIQVNLYGIADALSRSYAIPEAEFFRVLGSSLTQAVDSAGFSAGARAAVEKALFQDPEWPVKMVLAPLLGRSGPAGSSMPSGWGKTGNPFRRMAP
ncbi:IucA/IucC family protein [Archangium lansingense]|uniref:IucA/IucC family protein n=1 Tax=Archangium lansingense TaxID=2995310 RepID=UPI003B7C69DB